MVTVKTGTPMVAEVPPCVCPNPSVSHLILMTNLCDKFYPYPYYTMRNWRFRRVVYNRAVSGIRELPPKSVVYRACFLEENHLKF